MVAKTTHTGFPLIASKAAPMSEGMRFANEGAAFSWYSHGSRAGLYIPVPRGWCDALQVYAIKEKFERIVSENDLL